MKEYRKEQGDTAQDHYVANTANQHIVDAQAESQALANSMIKEFKEAMSTKAEAVKEPVRTEYASNTQQFRDPMLSTLIEQNQKLIELLS